VGHSRVLLAVDWLSTSDTVILHTAKVPYAAMSGVPDPDTKTGVPLTHRTAVR